MQPVHVAALGGQNEIIDVLINDYGVSPLSEVRIPDHLFLVPIVKLRSAHCFLHTGTSLFHVI